MKRSERLLRKDVLTAGLVLIVLLLVAAWNLSVLIPVQAALGKDTRNQGVTVLAYRTWAISPNGLVLDLWKVSSDKAPVDVFRAFMQASAALKSKKFARVTLTHRGKAIFVMSGSDFAALGESFDGGQNPLYLMQTLPSELHRPDGTDAFPTYTGGWLGVMSKELQEATSFALQWASGDPTATAPDNSLS